MASRKLSDIDFKDTLNREHVTAAWGLPDAYAGLNNAYCVYRVEEKEVWMTFEPLPPYRLLAVRNVPPSGQIAQKAGGRRLSDVTFQAGITYGQIASVWGRPDRFTGSGIDYFVYLLGNGQEVRMEFFPAPPYQLISAILMNPNREHKVLFDEY